MGPNQQINEAGGHALLEYVCAETDPRVPCEESLSTMPPGADGSKHVPAKEPGGHERCALSSDPNSGHGVKGRFLMAVSRKSYSSGRAMRYSPDSFVKGRVMRAKTGPRRCPIFIELEGQVIASKLLAAVSEQPAMVAVKMRDRGWNPYRVRFDDTRYAWIVSSLDQSRRP
jgi:hypothetical protein